jgi:hypothetical protein
MKGVVVLKLKVLPEESSIRLDDYGDGRARVPGWLKFLGQKSSSVALQTGTP